MKFSTREDIEAPIDFVYSQLSDFDGFERLARQRGVAVEQIAPGAPGGLHREWQAKARYRGKLRDIRLRVEDLRMADGYLVRSQVGGMVADVGVEMMALSRNRTRIVVGVELRPTTLSARLLVQSLKFAKKSLQNRYARRVASYAQAIGARHAGA